ncbi:Stress response protein ish1 [Psilocybe cubensis]|uniref:Meiotic sister chromatid recombination protein 1 n=2 Tax=Psilocybe cubensis TaxID=181762 RepID=A0A8H7XU92_PSICU|nr:Stress response protein ish1 [Psilocybe cubensis]KAH9476956.1 Stress response protein ish1 [Psilocybe cubensis]
MRLSTILVATSLALSAQASWFSGSSSEDPAYSSWNSNELRAWLEVHNVPLPSHTPSHSELRDLVAENWNTASAWSYDQYASAQKSFSDLRENAFETWDDSRLREFLLRHGVVSAKGPREHLVLLAKQKYLAYNKAASSFASQAGASASTAVYGDTPHQMSKSISSVASQATAAAAQASHEVARQLDNTKDYIYSSWSDNELRTWLEKKGVIKTKSQLRREELLQKMHDAYASVADPVWEAWSDSYMHDWLLSHHIIKSDYEKNRDNLVKQMKKYYYNTSDSVYSTWTDSQLKQWLVQHGIMKSDAQASRDKMLQMVETNYLSAKDTFWSAWSDHSLRDWLVEHGYMRSDAQVKRDELIKLANDKYTDQVAKTASYLTWSDARLRAYLREQGVDDHMLPTTRPGLLQETRIRWIQTHTHAENMIAKIKEIVNSGIYKAEDILVHLYHLLSGGWEETKGKADSTKRSAENTYDHAKHQGAMGYENVKKSAQQGWEDTKDAVDDRWEETKNRADWAKDWTKESAEDVRQNVGEKVKVGGQKIKGEL